MPPTEVSRRLSWPTPLPLPLLPSLLNAASTSAEPSLARMITRIFLSGFFFAPSSRLGSTYADLSRPSPRQSLPSRGPPANAVIGSVSATSAIAVVTQPRLRRSTSERCSPPRLPVPQRALERVSPAPAADFLMSLLLYSVPGRARSHS